MPARKSAAINKKRVHRDPAFQRTRENMAEFGQAGTANKLLRYVFHEALFNVADRYVSGRLTKRMLRIVHSDPTRGRGKRIVTAEALPMLQGFNFNRNTTLGDTLYAPYEVSFTRATGLAEIHIPFFSTATMINTLSKAPCYNITGCAAAIDFKYRNTEFVLQQTGIIEFNNHRTKSIYLALQLPPDNPHPIVVALGVEFPDDKVFNAMAVVKVITG